MLCQERLDQKILQVPSNLIRYDLLHTTVLPDTSTHPNAQLHLSYGYKINYHQD